MAAFDRLILQDMIEAERAAKLGKKGGKKKKGKGKKGKKGKGKGKGKKKKDPTVSCTTMNYFLLSCLIAHQLWLFSNPRVILMI